MFLTAREPVTLFLLAIGCTFLFVFLLTSLLRFCVYICGGEEDEKPKTTYWPSMRTYSKSLHSGSTEQHFVFVQDPSNMVIDVSPDEDDERQDLQVIVTQSPLLEPLPTKKTKPRMRSNSEPIFITLSEKTSTTKKTNPRMRSNSDPIFITLSEKTSTTKEKDKSDESDESDYYMC